MTSMNVADILSNRAKLTPDKTAIRLHEKDAGFTYGELEIRANRLGRYLDSVGIGCGDRVGILAPNGVYYVDLFFAAAKLGAIFAPINWRLTLPEIEGLLATTKPKLLLFDPAYENVAEALKTNRSVPHFLNLVEYEACIDSMGSSPLEPRDIEPETPHTIFFTSGTTGKPKGAVLPHRMIFWNSINTILSWQLNCDDRAPIFTPMFHSGGINVLLIPLFHIGGTVIISESFEPGSALELISKERATIVFMVPTMFRMMAAHPEFSSTDLGRIRFLISGGAPCPLELMETYRDRGVIVKQGYGMTEVGVNAFSMTAEESTQKTGSVGKPIFYSDTQIVNEQGQPLSDGDVGELCIGGPHVFSGYWNEPDWTKSTFVDGWFHTGDLARRDEENFYYIVGRKKEMIISGGENVYLAEVEAALTRHPNIEDAAVVGIPDEKWGEIGRAIVVLNTPDAMTSDEILNDLKQQLAKFKIPKEIVFTNEIPRNAYGKIERKVLKDKYSAP